MRRLRKSDRSSSRLRKLSCSTIGAVERDDEDLVAILRHIAQNLTQFNEPMRRLGGDDFGIIAVQRLVAFYSHDNASIAASRHQVAGSGQPGRDSRLLLPAACCPKQPPMGVCQPPMAVGPPVQHARPAVGALVAAMMPVGVILAEASVAGMASADRQDFVVTLQPGRQRLSLGVDAARSEEFGHVHEFAAGPVDPHPVIVIHREVKRIVEQADARP